MAELTVRPNRAQPEMALTMRDVVMPVFRQRRLAGLIFLGIFVGALLCALLLPRKYEAEMKILVNRERVDAVVTPDPDNVNGPGIVPAVSEEDLNSEVELIKSRDLLERVVLACGVETKPRGGNGLTGRRSRCVALLRRRKRNWRGPCRRWRSG